MPTPSIAPIHPRPDRAATRAVLMLALCLLPAVASVAETTIDAGQAALLAGTCAACHGTDGTLADGIEPLAGRSRDSLIDALLAYREGRLPATIMDRIARGYSEAEIAAIAGYLSSVDPAAR